MDIEIRKLAPELAEEYACFFDTTPHNGEGDGIKCYCVIMRSDDSYAGNDHWYPTQEERRERAVQFIRNGSLQGYLAYHGDQIVGWCNANAECRLGVEHLRSFWPIDERHEGVKIKSVFCFMIAPEMQRRGVATKLLNRVCEDAAFDGYDFVEGYADRNSTIINHTGPLSMYEKCGFINYAEHDGKIVMRRTLK